MNGVVGLNAQSLAQAADKIKRAALRIDESIKRIDSIMADMDSVWSDDNSKKYLARYEELKQNFPKFQSAAHSYSDFLMKVVEAYDKEFLNPTSSSVTTSGTN